MPEASLGFEVFFHRPQFRNLNGDAIAAVDHLIERKDAGFHRQAADPDGLVGRHAPPGGADREDVDVGRTRCAGRFLHLFHQVEGIAGTGRGHIGDVVSDGDFGHVLFPGDLPGDLLAGRRGGGAGAEGGGRGALDAGVHIGFVVVTDVYEVVAPLEGARKGLKADVGGGAVAAHAEKDRAPILDAPFARQGLVSRLNP